MDQADKLRELMIAQKIKKSTHFIAVTSGKGAVTLEVKHLPEHTHSYTRKIYASLYNFWGEERDDGWDRWSYLC